ncbi:HPr family phosphocarrier protein [Pseudoflavonifractor phocaeensis]|uniref:HPr family phosphocarrier protein n=1 Tax=Pseudoflavonifractor phocaeensis TaxID=1870988 RepID=UPI0025A45873|nr:HPr family phosphocarrier protein [Pseudoflavonifractor phocaeensis]MDM8239198.1 HPr family phosphocarrier protein [Pseudoflavonifractor phocaeensis]
MKSFTYTITDPVGIHARPAGLLVKAAKAFAGTEISVTKGDKTAKSTQLMKLMGLGVKGGDTVTVTADGPDEEKAIAAMEQFFKKNL